LVWRLRRHAPALGIPLLMTGFRFRRLFTGRWSAAAYWRRPPLPRFARSPRTVASSPFIGIPRSCLVVFYVLLCGGGANRPPPHPSPGRRRSHAAARFGVCFFELGLLMTSHWRRLFYPFSPSLRPDGAEQIKKC